MRIARHEGSVVNLEICTNMEAGTEDDGAFKIPCIKFWFGRVAGTCWEFETEAERDRIFNEVFDHWKMK